MSCRSLRVHTLCQQEDKHGRYGCFGEGLPLMFRDLPGRTCLDCSSLEFFGIASMKVVDRFLGDPRIYARGTSSLYRYKSSGMTTTWALANKASLKRYCTTLFSVFLGVAVRAGFIASEFSSVSSRHDMAFASEKRTTKCRAFVTPE